jgi:uncharacterized protein
MTTNAMLLDRHAKYLVDNDFKILFSLDGNEKGNSLRVDKNQKPSFNRVFKNLKNFQHDYPEFFASNVEFNSVLSAMSSAEDVNNFIVEEFGKNPSISAMSPLGVSKDKMQEYRDLMQPYLETDELIASKKERSARVKAVGSFFYNSLNNSYKHYSEIIHFDKKSQKKIPGGTCLPFLKKMFITSDCKIMACERIGMEYELGTVDDKVNIDFEKVAELYTFYFSEVKKQCMNCYMVNTCSECIFQFPTENSIPKCPNIYSEIEYQHHLGRMMTFLEKESGYFNYVNNVVFG